MSEETEQLHVKVDSDLKKRAKEKLPHGGLSEQVRRTLQRVVDGNAERFQLRDELADLRDKRQKLKREREALDREISDIERKIERKEEKLEQYSDPESEYQGYIKSMLETMEADGTRVFVSHAQIEEAALIGGKEQEEVIDEMKELVEQNDYDIQDSQFR